MNDFFPISGFWAEALGVAAGSLTTFAFLPQVLKIWRERSAAGLSLSTFAIFTSGVFLWLIYGFFIGSFAVTFFNAITLVLAGAIVLGAWRFRHK